MNALTKLVRDVRQPQPMGHGSSRRYDDDRREDRCHLCMFCQPLQGWRHVKGPDRRTAQDCAHGLQAVVESHGPEATWMSVGMDHLNPHAPAGLYAAFTPAEARRLLWKLGVRDPPKPGSWLNMAEMEVAVWLTQSIDQRLPSQAAGRRTVASWATGRNAEQGKVNWRFTIPKARRTLQRLYPS